MVDLFFGRGVNVNVGVGLKNGIFLYWVCEFFFLDIVVFFFESGVDLKV